MAPTVTRWIVPLVAGLCGSLFVLDLFMPLGVANGVLYAGVVLLASWSSNPHLPLLTAAAVTILLLFGTFLGPRISHVPLWIGLVNHTFAMVVVWLSALLLRQRHQSEIRLRQVNEALEDRVGERTKELAKVNRTLIREISEHVDTERSLREREHELAASRRELQDLAARLLTAQEEERRRISRDLHDDINQRLAMLVVQVESLDADFPSSPDRCRTELRSIQDRLTELSDDVRHLAYQFHPSILDDLGLSIALQRLVDEYAARTGLSGAYMAPTDLRPLPQNVATCLYRIAQESLANVVKHAQATAVTVTLRTAQDAVSLIVEDDGVGMDRASDDGRSRGLGMVSMTERVRLVGGTVTIDSTPRRGTRLSVHIPSARVPA